MPITPQRPLKDFSRDEAIRAWARRALVNLANWSCAFKGRVAQRVSRVTGSDAASVAAWRGASVGAERRRSVNRLWKPLCSERPTKGALERAARSMVVSQDSGLGALSSATMTRSGALRERAFARSVEGTSLRASRIWISAPEQIE